jgi:hypothetical protein
MPAAAVSWRWAVLLGLAGLGISLAAAAFQAVPGYMDAEYYFAGGQRLAQGYGFSEPYLWNYLDDPPGLPHPSHAYWMPLASLLAAGGMTLAGSTSFAAGRLGFLAAAALLPPLTMALAWRLSQQRQAARLAGLLALFPGLYLPFVTTSDTFVLVMLLGAAWLLAALRLEDPGVRRPAWLALGLGVAAGLMHLARADGLLWLGISLLAAAWLPGGEPRRKGEAWLRAAAVLVGYGVVMGPWLGRNLAVFGSALAPGGGRALWLTTYDELFAYPAGQLTAQRWLASGPGAILHARLAALSLNLQTALAVQGQIFLAPLVAIGLWRLRRRPAVRLELLAWLAVLLAMTLAFPFAGGRGGFFHSGAALQPLFWAAAPLGLEAAVSWAGARRRWNLGQAQAVFQAGAVLLALMLSLVVFQQRVIGADYRQPAWGSGAAQFASLEQALQGYGAGQDEVVMTINPPGYSLASGRRAIAIPDGGEQALLAAARRYAGRYLLLGVDHPDGLEAMYTAPGDRPGWRYLGSAGQYRIYRREEGGG